MTQRSTLGGVKGVLFDLDNTLYDRDRAFAAWARWFVGDRLGVRGGAELARTVETMVALDAGGYGPKDALFRRLKARHPCLEENVDLLVEAFREQLLGHVVAVDDGASRLLDALDQGKVPWGIVTNGSAGQLRKVRQLGLDGRATCVVVSAMLGAWKPAPQIFQAATARLGVEPREIVFVGDHPEVDIVGAAKAGMRTAWVHRGREWPGHLAAFAPDHSIDCLADLFVSAGSTSAPDPDCPNESTPLHSATLRAPQA